MQAFKLQVAIGGDIGPLGIPLMNIYIITYPRYVT